MSWSGKNKRKGVETGQSDSEEEIITLDGLRAIFFLKMLIPFTKTLNKAGFAENQYDVNKTREKPFHGSITVLTQTEEPPDEVKEELESIMKDNISDDNLCERVELKFKLQ